MGSEFDDDEIPIGSVCMDRAGNVGVVEWPAQACSLGQCGLVTYHGKTLDGKPWQSSVPTKLADSLAEYKP